MRRTRLLLAACTSALAMSLSAPLGASASPGASVEPSDRDAARALLEDILKILDIPDIRLSGMFTTGYQSLRPSDLQILTQVL